MNAMRIGAVLLLVMGLAPMAAAQQGGWGPGTPYGRLYDSATVVTLQGSVAAIDSFAAPSRATFGIHVRLKTEAGVIPVHLGPSWFLKQQTLQVRVGDVLEVTGSRVVFEGKPAIIAAVIVRDSARLLLRKRSGIPVWARSRSGRRTL